MGCANDGIARVNALGTAEDMAGAFQAFTKSCAGGEAIGCHGAGVLLNVGVGTARDEVKAQELLKKACSFGFERACQATRP